MSRAAIDPRLTTCGSEVRVPSYVVSGGGGAGLYPLKGCEGPYAQSKYGFMIVNVNGKTVDETLYDEQGAQLYASGAFQAFGEAPNFKGLDDLVLY